MTTSELIDIFQLAVALWSIMLHRRQLDPSSD